MNHNLTVITSLALALILSTGCRQDHHEPASAVPSATRPSAEGTADVREIRLEGTVYLLQVTRKELDSSTADDPAGNQSNKPTSMILTIGDAEAVFTNRWNDGLSLSIEDIDTADGMVNLCIHTSGTDTIGSTHIYTFDGSTISHYTSFTHEWRDWIHDGAGMIFHSPNRPGAGDYTGCYNYRTRQIEPHR